MNIDPRFTAHYLTEFDLIACPWRLWLLDLATVRSTLDMSSARLLLATNAYTIPDSIVSGGFCDGYCGRGHFKETLGFLEAFKVAGVSGRALVTRLSRLLGIEALKSRSSTARAPLTHRRRVSDFGLSAKQARSRSAMAR